jgi:hypothetical protein
MVVDTSIMIHRGHAANYNTAAGRLVGIWWL